jgi:hypothetical protein
MLKSSVENERAYCGSASFPQSRCEPVPLRYSDRHAHADLPCGPNVFARRSIMEITKEQLIAMANAISLDIAEGDLENVRVRLSTLLTEMEGIERELGAEMDEVEPVPPVYPREEF